MIPEILAVTDEEVAAVAAGDMNRYDSILAPDAAFLPPNLPPQTGAGLRSWLRDFLERFRVEWLTFVHVDTVFQGDLAVHSYEYSWRVTPKASGEPVVSHGKGLHILRREPDGRWRLWREIWNPSPKAPEAR